MAALCTARFAQIVPASIRAPARADATSRCVARASARAGQGRVSLPSQGSNVFSKSSASLRRSGSPATSRGNRLVVRAAEEKEFKQNTEFGYSRKDVLLIGFGLLVAGFGSYYGMLAAGVDLVVAGNIEILVFVLGLTVAWTASYVFRVAKKDMTYVKQLKDYEDAVMAKRLEEMPEAEIEALLSEMDDTKK
uniref:Uncharacterized protein n=2 Tax=Pyramimonas obovata TaxID=1411642 RepID=A0A7S0WV90_9CHLO